jgi:hypothetical protein
MDLDLVHHQLLQAPWKKLATKQDERECERSVAAPKIFTRTSATVLNMSRSGKILPSTLATRPKRY